MSKYKIIEEQQWYSNGCDCCEPDYFNIYYLEVGGVPMTHPNGDIFYFPDIETVQGLIFRREDIDVDIQYTNQEYND